MKIKTARILFLFLTISSLLTVPSGCSILNRSSKARVEKKKAKEDARAAKEYEKAREQHYKNQSKSTQKMMKITRKRASQVNKPKQRGKFSGKKCY